jgi:hypothetical protein
MPSVRPAQTYSNHVRFHPIFHFFAIPILSLNVLYSLYLIYRTPGFATIWGAIVAFAILAGVLLTRVYGLRNQDRIIRLEERVRLASVLPADLRGHIGELSMNDLIGLRFCCDDEVTDAVRSVLSGGVAGRKAIKAGVKNWRPDYHRL